MWIKMEFTFWKSQFCTAFILSRFSFPVYHNAYNENNKKEVNNNNKIFIIYIKIFLIYATELPKCENFVRWLRKIKTKIYKTGWLHIKLNADFGDSVQTMWFNIRSSFNEKCITLNDFFRLFCRYHKIPT